MCTCVCVNVCVWVGGCGYVHMCSYLQRPDEGIKSPGAGVLGVCDDVLMWVLGTEFGSSGRVTNTLKHCAISPDSSESLNN